MNTRFAAALFLMQVWLGGLALPALAQQRPAEVTLSGTELHQFRSNSGTEYTLYVAPPQVSKPEDGSKHPVLYVLDPAIFFSLVFDTLRLMQLAEELPPLILVGVEQSSSSLPEFFARRYLDLTPSRVPKEEQESSEKLGQEVRTGGAHAFLSLLTDEIFPWVEARYPASSQRGLVGHSLGGLFAAHVLLTSQHTFTHYLISSPSLWWDDRAIFEREKALAAHSKELTSRVFISVGTHEDLVDEEEYEMLPDMLTLVDTLESRGYDGLQLQSHIFVNETHMSVVPAAYSRGLRFLFGCR
jgi:predicted alpha/beta superfamily hydrolase